MRRTLAAIACTLVTTAAVVATTIVPASAANPIFCFIATTQDPRTGRHSTGPFCAWSQPYGAYCENDHYQLLGTDPNNPNDPTAYHAWTAYCVMTP